VACALSPAWAQAGSSYSYVFDQPTYQVDPGSQVLVKVFLQEHITDGSLSVLATEGLVGAGVRVSFDLSPLPGDPAKVLSAGDVIPNDGSGAFDGGFQSIALVPGSYADLTESVDLFSPAVLGTQAGADLYQVLLGTFRFTAGAIVGQTTLIQASDIPGTLDTVTTSDSIIDGQILSSAVAQFQVGTAAVPEPSSVITLTLGMIALGCFGTTQRTLRQRVEPGTRRRPCRSAKP
jgi:hypothetical protein